FFLFTATSTPEIYTLSLHDALPISVTKILKAMAFRPARGEWQYRVFAIQGLNVRLLIDAKHGRMGWRVQVQANDVGRLLLKVRIDRKSTRLNSSHVEISYAVFCLKK